jgi:sigma-E factor negative regulatory protein RseC
MLRQTEGTARVIDIHGDTATVVINRSRRCSECGKAQAGICGQGGAGMVLRVRNTIGAAKGDTVVVSLDRRTHYKAYLVAFVIPVMALFVGTYAGSLLSGIFRIGSLDVILGILFLALSLVISMMIIRSLDRSNDMYISRILHDHGDYDIGSSVEGEEYLRAFAHNK